MRVQTLLFFFVPDKIIATDAGRLAVLTDGLPSLLRPIIRSLFVGTKHPLYSVSLNVVLQCVEPYIFTSNADILYHFNKRDARVLND